MIKFPCKCGHVFEVGDDMAGGLIQCTQCGLLNDVPNAADLDNLADDGTFLVDETIDLLPPDHVADLARAYSNRTTDSTGEEKDLRLKVDDLALVGTDPELIPVEDDVIDVRPRYDPETGELVRPLEFKKDDTPPLDEIPIAKTAINYASNETRRQVRLSNVFVELFMPGNIVVLFVVLIVQCVAWVLNILLAIPALFFGVGVTFLNVVAWALMAHYACVIEDVGPDGRDELPRPGRNLDLAEDLWNPFIRMAEALIVCYGPARLAAHFGREHEAAVVPAILLLELVGTVFLPAVMLTTVTGTTTENLRPDRVLGVIRACGIQYWLSVLLWAIASVPASFLWFGQTPMISIYSILGLRWVSTHVPGIGWAILLISVYLLHLFCWHLGLLYREHHDQFPWVLQRHVPTRTERQKQIAEVMAAQARRR